MNLIFVAVLPLMLFLRLVVLSDRVGEKDWKFLKKVVAGFFTAAGMLIYLLGISQFFDPEKVTALAITSWLGMTCLIPPLYMYLQERYSSMVNISWPFIEIAGCVVLSCVPLFMTIGL